MLDNDLRLKKELTLSDTKNCKVTSLSINKSESFLIVGHDDGLLSLYNIKTYQHIPPNLKVHSNAILDAKFLLNTELKFVSYGNEGALKYSRLKITNQELNITSSILFTAKTIHSLYPISIDTPLIVISNHYSVQAININRDDSVVWEYKLDNKMSIATYLGFRLITIENRMNVPVLAIGSGKRLILLELIKSSYKLIGLHEISEPINYLGWVEDSCLIVLQGTKALNLFYAKNIMKGRLGVMCVDEFKTPCEEFRTRELVGGNKTAGEELSYHQCIATTTWRVVCLMGKRVIVGRMKMWFEYLNSMAINKDQFNKVIIAVCQMSRGNLKGLIPFEENQNDRKRSIKEWLKNHLEQFYFLAFEVKDTLIKEDLQLVIEALLTIFKEEDYITQNLFDLFHEKEKGNFFIEALEPFMKDFKNINVDFVNRILQYYKDNLRIIENIIIRTKSREEDIRRLIQICKDNKLFTGHIYLSNLIREYKEPLIAMWNALCKKELIESDLMSLDEGSKMTSGYVKYKMLWYIDSCFCVKNYSMQEVKDPSKMIIAILNCVMQEKMLKELLPFNPEVTLNKVFLKIFTNKKIKNAIFSILTKRSIKTTFSYNGFLEHILSIIKELEGNINVFKEYLKFLVEVFNHSEIQLDPELRINNSLACAQLLLTYTKQDGLEKELEILVLDLLESLPNIPSLDKLEQQYENTPYTEIKLFLKEQTKEFIEVLNMHLSEKSKKIFNWLTRMHKRFSANAEEYKQLHEAIINNIEVIVTFLYAFIDND